MSTKLYNYQLWLVNVIKKMFKNNKVYVYIFKGNKVMLVNLENDSVIKSLIKLSS